MTTFNVNTVKFSDFVANDKKGNSFVKSFGFDKDGNHVATTHGCDKDNCNCVGNWKTGHVDDVVNTVTRKDAKNEN